MRITKLTRHDDARRPYFTANVSAGENGEAVTLPASDRHGSWTVQTPEGERDLHPGVARALQERAYGKRRGPR